MQKKKKQTATSQTDGKEKEQQKLVSDCLCIIIMSSSPGCLLKTYERGSEKGSFGHYNNYNVIKKRPKFQNFTCFYNEFKLFLTYDTIKAANVHHLSSDLISCPQNQNGNN